MMRLGLISLTAAGLMACATGVAAQERNALVVANSAYADALALPDVRDTALEMSEALFGLGFNVSRLENPTLDQMREAVTAVQASGGPVVIYYAGHGFAHDGASYLQPVGVTGVESVDRIDASLPVSALFATSGTSETMIFLDTCHGPASQAMIGAGALDRSLAESATGIFNLLTVTSVQPGVACPEAADAVPSLTTFLLDRLNVPGLPSDEILPEVADLPAFVPPTASEEDLAAAADIAPPMPGLWAATTLTTPFVFRVPTGGQRLTAEDYAILETMSPSARNRMIALWQQAGIPVDIAGSENTPAVSNTVDVVANDGVVLVAPVQAVTAASRVSVASVATVADGVSIFNANPTPAPTTAARPVPGAGGLPIPSIIVGLPEVVVEASFEAAPEDVGPVSGAELSFDNLDARRAMKASDETLFASLVETGAFDPPPAALASALQTELKRMGCYTSVIDGIWGRGSRASVDRYYNELEGDLSSPSQDPDVRIFRQIVMKDDVECPAPVVAAPAPRRQTTTTTTRRQTTTQAAPRRATPAPAAPAPAAPSGRRTLSNAFGGTGGNR